MVTFLSAGFGHLEVKDKQIYTPLGIPLNAYPFKIIRVENLCRPKRLKNFYLLLLYRRGNQFFNLPTHFHQRSQFHNIMMIRKNAKLFLALHQNLVLSLYLPENKLSESSWELFVLFERKLESEFYVDGWSSLLFSHFKLSLQTYPFQPFLLLAGSIMGRGRSAELDPVPYLLNFSTWLPVLLKHVWKKKWRDR